MHRLTSAERSWVRVAPRARTVAHRFLFVQGVQMLDSGNRDFPPIVLDKDRNWRIIGKVLWWIRSHES
jgi:hypothetical protein